MQEWSTLAIIISKKPFGETSAIVTVLTPQMGLCSGLFKGAKSKRNRAIVEVGNLVTATWKSRLNEQLGFFVFELIHNPFAFMVSNPGPLRALKISTDLLSLVLAEREPHPKLYTYFLDLIDALKGKEWLEAYIKFEILLLQELGFGLSLEECAVTGSKQDLIYVSPKSGRAVSKDVGAPYSNQLLRLPGFLKNGGKGDQLQYQQALSLTGYFLEKHSLPPSKKNLLGDRFYLISLVR